MNSKKTFVFSVFTLITSIAWLGVSIYYIYFPQIPETVENKILIPLDIEKFPIETLKKLPEKTFSTTGTPEL